MHHFLNTFSQLPAVKKYSKNGADGKKFGPSYFDPALVEFIQVETILVGDPLNGGENFLFIT